MKFTLLDFVKKLPNIVVIKREVSGQKCKQNNTTGPNVGRGAMVGFAAHNLWRSIMRRATRSLKHTIRGFKCCHAKVSNFDVAILVKKQIFWLEITVTNVKSVAVVNSVYNLTKIINSFLFF